MSRFDTLIEKLVVFNEAQGLETTLGVNPNEYLYKVDTIDSATDIIKQEVENEPFEMKQDGQVVNYYFSNELLATYSITDKILTFPEI